MPAAHAPQPAMHIPQLAASKQAPGAAAQVFPMLHCSAIDVIRQVELTAELTGSSRRRRLLRQAAAGGGGGACGTRPLKPAGQDCAGGPRRWLAADILSQQAQQRML